MEATMSASQGPMRSLPWKLGSLLSGTKYGLRAEEQANIRILKSGLEDLIANYLLEPSEVESPTSMAHSWMKEVRDLSYDIDDFIYELGQAGTSGARINAVKKSPRFKVSRSLFPVKLKRRQWITDEISGFRVRVSEAIRRHKEYLGAWKRRPSSRDLGQRSFPPSPCSESSTGIRLVGVDSSIGQLCGWMSNDEQPDHKVASIVGTGGVGKTTLAKEVYLKLGDQFDCKAFVQASRKTDMKMFLTSILSQVRRHHLPVSCEVRELMCEIKEHLQDKTYLIVIDDLWALSTWDTVNRALPKGEHCSRILTTTEVNIIADKCCVDKSKCLSPKKEDSSTYSTSKTEDNSSHMLVKKKDDHMPMPSYKEDDYRYIIKKGPLCEDESRELLLSTIFGLQAECPQGLKEVSNEIIRRCGGLPLTVIILASLLARLPDRSIERWNYIKNSLSSGLTRNNISEGINQVLNLCYDNLPHCLKACMLYLCMYEEDSVILKDDLVKQWIAEGFVCAMERGDGQEVAQSYFDELVNRGMIQPVDINCNDEILSCSVHRIVLHFIRYKSIEENFSIAIDYSQTTIKLADKVRRLALHFGNVEDATPPAPACMRLSKVRSLAFSGFLKCMPSIAEFRFLQVLILKLLAGPNNRSDSLTESDDLSGNLTEPDDLSYNLSEISELFRLRYFRLDACHMTVELPTQMQRLKDLVAWEIDAEVTSVPSDIVDLPGLFYLSFPREAHLPTSIGRMISLRTLGVIDLSRNSTENFTSLGELTNLQDLRLTCSTLQPDNLEKNLECLGSIIRKLSNLKCVTLVPAISSHLSNHLDAGASSMSISWHGFSIVPLPPSLLQRLELSRRCCIFSSIPEWTKALAKLRILKIALRKVSSEDVVILKGLPSLSALSLFIWTVPVRKIMFDDVGFSVLKYFKFQCAAPCLVFLDGAMTNVRILKLGFNGNRMDRYNLVAAGFEHMISLNEISTKIGGANSHEYKRFAKAVLTDAISNHPRNPIINVKCVDWNIFGDNEKYIEGQKDLWNQASGKQDVTAGESSDEHGIQEKDLDEDTRKHADIRASTSPESTSQLHPGWQVMSPTFSDAKAGSGRFPPELDMQKTDPHRPLFPPFSSSAPTRASQREDHISVVPSDDQEKVVTAAQHITKSLAISKYGGDDMIPIISCSLKAAPAELAPEDQADSMEMEKDEVHPSGDDDERDVAVELAVRVVEQCHSLPAGDRLVFESAEDVKEYLTAVTCLVGVTGARAEAALQVAMARLEEEFRQLLIRGAASPTAEYILRSLVADGEISPYLIFPDTVSTVKDIADVMLHAGHAPKLCQVYGEVRRYKLMECLAMLGVDKMSLDEMHFVEWRVLDSKMKKWIQALKVVIRGLLAEERRICSQIFAADANTEAECFSEAAKGCVLHLLSFGDAIATGKISQERIFRILGMYEALGELLPELVTLFSGEARDFIKEEAERTLVRLGDAVRGTIAEFVNWIHRETSRKSLPDGGIHPLTQYVMNYVVLLADYNCCLNKLLDSCEPDQLGNSDMTPLGHRVVILITHLWNKIEDKSKLYDDEALQNIFLLNNLVCIVQKVMNSELKSWLGEKWLRMRGAQMRTYFSGYLRSSWTRVIAYLSADGLLRMKGRSSAFKDELKERFKNFNLAYEELYMTQTTWKVVEPELREKLKISISKNLIPAYRSFFGRYRGQLEGLKNFEEYVKYNPEDLEKQILYFFEGKSSSN